MLKYILLILIGLSAGGCVAAGLFAFIVALGVINHLVRKTNTAKYIRFYEIMVIAGGVLLNIVQLFSSSLPSGYVGVIAFGLFSGIFIGVQSMALAEIVKTLPLLVTRVKLIEGLPFIVLAIALGKSIVTLFGFLYK